MTAPASPDRDGFLQLWPTTLLQQELPGHARANPALRELVLGLEAGHADLTTDYLGGNLFELDHPAVAWLRECVNGSIVQYLRRQGLDYAVDWTLQAWANVNRLGDYHDPHNHPHSYLSGTYYVAIPETLADLPGRGDRRPGAITFYDPRAQANMNAIRGDAQVDPEHTVRPRPGLLLLWPAFLHHFVHPNLSHELRVSISFNVVLRWSDAYLPDQG